MSKGKKEKTKFEGDVWARAQMAVNNLNKKFGEDSVVRLGSCPIKKYESIPSGSIALDLALGNGGYPKGRIIEVYGPESSGKTTVCLHAVAEAQKQGRLAAFIDVEHALDPIYAKNLGVDIENLFVAQPESGEEALEIAEELVRSGAFDVVVVDSVASLVPKAELEGSMGDSHVGLQARLMSQALRKITGAVHKSNCVLYFTNQLREKVGVMFGSPEVTAGGRALKFYASIRMDIRRAEQIKTGEEFTGIRSRVRIVKNKCAPPFSVAEFDIEFGVGISKVGEILDFGIETDNIIKSGAWFTAINKETGEILNDKDGNPCKWQGRENAKQALRDNPEIVEFLEKRIRLELGMLDSEIEEEDSNADE